MYSGLVMFSGGLDSVALLANLLQETDQALHVHHIEIQNYENRAQAENDAVRRTLAHFRQHYREFSYSSSKSEFPLGRGGGFDLTLVLFTAARVHTALGRVVDIVYTGHIAPTQAEILEGSAVFNACYINKRFKPKWLRPLAHLKKRDIYAIHSPGTGGTGLVVSKTGLYRCRIRTLRPVPHLQELGWFSVAAVDFIRWRWRWPIDTIARKLCTARTPLEGRGATARR